MLAAAREIHYRPNTLARSLRQQRSFTIGVMVPEISEGYTALVIAGIEDHLLNEGYLYFVASHRHRPDLIAESPSLMMGRSVEGLIAVDTLVSEEQPVPVVAVSGHGGAEGVTNIVLDHALAANLALEHLQSPRPPAHRVHQGPGVQLRHRGALVGDRSAARERGADGRSATHEAARREFAVARTR